MLEEHRVEVEALTDALMEYETLTAGEVAAVLRGDTVEAVRKAMERDRAATTSDAEGTATETPQDDDADDLEAKGRFAY